MGLGLKERIELMRQGIIHRYIIPSLEMRGFIVADWKRPISLEDMILRDEGWIPQYTPYTTWETYKRDAPLYLYFNTFYGDVYERAYRHCFVEYIINLHNYPLPPKLLGIFTRLNVENGYYWKHRVAIDLTYPENAVTEIDSKYDELTLLLSREGIAEAGESESEENEEEK
ncbi:MAG: hypothetical protein NXY59_06215 [Aigarchaeota archaeon]|nr:hypothetical protein [Candidatus Pelearchaeum maunauluense]